MDGVSSMTPTPSCDPFSPVVVTHQHQQQRRLRPPPPSTSSPHHRRRIPPPPTTTREQLPLRNGIVADPSIQHHDDFAKADPPALLESATNDLFGFFKYYSDCNIDSNSNSSIDCDRPELQILNVHNDGNDSRHLSSQSHYRRIASTITTGSLSTIILGRRRYGGNRLRTLRRCALVVDGCYNHSETYDDGDNDSDNDSNNDGNDSLFPGSTSPFYVVAVPQVSKNKKQTSSLRAGSAPVFSPSSCRYKILIEEKEENSTLTRIIHCDRPESDSLSAGSSIRSTDPEQRPNGSTPIIDPAIHQVSSSHQDLTVAKATSTALRLHSSLRLNARVNTNTKLRTSSSNSNSKITNSNIHQRTLPLISLAGFLPRKAKKTFETTFHFRNREREQTNIDLTKGKVLSTTDGAGGGLGDIVRLPAAARIDRNNNNNKDHHHHHQRQALSHSANGLHIDPSRIIDSYMKDSIMMRWLDRVEYARGIKHRSRLEKNVQQVQQQKQQEQRQPQHSCFLEGTNRKSWSDYELHPCITKMPLVLKPSRLLAHASASAAGGGEATGTSINMTTTTTGPPPHTESSAPSASSSVSSSSSSSSSSIHSVETVDTEEESDDTDDPAMTAAVSTTMDDVNRRNGGGGGHGAAAVGGVEADRHDSQAGTGANSNNNNNNQDRNQPRPRMMAIRWSDEAMMTTMGSTAKNEAACDSVSRRFSSPTGGETMTACRGEDDSSQQQQHQQQQQAAAALEEVYWLPADEEEATCRIMILLIDPIIAAFEFLHCEFMTEERLSVQDLLQQLPGMATIDNFNQLSYVALYRDGCEMINVLALQDYRLVDGEILVAIRSGCSAAAIVIEAETLLHDKVLRKTLRKARICGRALQRLQCSAEWHQVQQQQQQQHGQHHQVEQQQQQVQQQPPQQLKHEEPRNNDKQQRRLGRGEDAGSDLSQTSSPHKRRQRHDHNYRHDHASIRSKQAFYWSGKAKQQQLQQRQRQKDKRNEGKMTVLIADPQLDARGERSDSLDILKQQQQQQLNSDILALLPSNEMLTEQANCRIIIAGNCKGDEWEQEHGGCDHDNDDVRNVQQDCSIDEAEDDGPTLITMESECSEACTILTVSTIGDDCFGETRNDDDDDDGDDPSNPAQVDDRA